MCCDGEGTSDEREQYSLAKWTKGRGFFRFRGGLARDQARTNEIKRPGSREDDVSGRADGKMNLVSQSRICLKEISAF